MCILRLPVSQSCQLRSLAWMSMAASLWVRPAARRAWRMASGVGLRASRWARVSVKAGWPMSHPKDQAQTRQPGLEPMTQSAAVGGPLAAVDVLAWVAVSVEGMTVAKVVAGHVGFLFGFHVEHSLHALRGLRKRGATRNFQRVTRNACCNTCNTGATCVLVARKKPQKLQHMQHHPLGGVACCSLRCAKTLRCKQFFTHSSGALE